MKALLCSTKQPRSCEKYDSDVTLHELKQLNILQLKENEKNRVLFSGIFGGNVALTCIEQYRNTENSMILPVCSDNGMPS